MKAEVGVYFRREDCAPFWKRALVDLTDLFVFGIICFLLFLPVVLFFDFTRTVLNLGTTMIAAAAFLYFVVLKRSAFRTVGYRLLSVQIVGVDGERPGYWALITRLMFGFFGPFNWIFDLVWLSNDPNRQALRDKFANTYVINAGAVPAGTGPVTLQQYDILMFNFLFREVTREN